jgi:hypothetical protein
MTDEEIIGAIKAVRYSSTAERNARKRLSMNAIAKSVGVSPNYLYELCKGAPIGRFSRQRLSEFFTSQQNDGGKAGVRPADAALPAVSKSSHYS